MRQPHVQPSGTEVVERCILLDCSTLHIHTPNPCGVLHTKSRMSAAFFNLHDVCFINPRQIRYSSPCGTATVRTSPSWRLACWNTCRSYVSWAPRASADSPFLGGKNHPFLI